MEVWCRCKSLRTLSSPTSSSHLKNHPNALRPNPGVEDKTRRDVFRQPSSLEEAARCCVCIEPVSSWGKKDWCGSRPSIKTWKRPALTFNKCLCQEKPTTQHWVRPSSLYQQYPSPPITRRTQTLSVYLLVCVLLLLRYISLSRWDTPNYSVFRDLNNNLQGIEKVKGDSSCSWEQWSNLIPRISSF